LRKEAIRGHYKVNVERVTKAKAEPLTEDERAHLGFMLENEDVT